MVSVSLTPDSFDARVGTIIVGAGAAGLTTALACEENCLVIEADPVPAGSTALSAGLIPAAGTRFQRDAGIDDDPARFARDIQDKAHGNNDRSLVDAMAGTAGHAIEWLADIGLPFSLVTDFDYPGHSRRRMHGLPSRSGRELVDALRSAAERQGIDILCGRRVDKVYWDENRITGIGQVTGDRLGCDRLVLACNGFGGNRQMVAAHMPLIADALWFGHDGNRGEAVQWGEALGAATGQLGAYQGHGNVAHPHGILITWAVIMEGGIQVNAHGQRFWDETQGYSEAARRVLAQPGGTVWTIFDARIARVARQFEDFRQAEAQGAVRAASDLAELADVTGLTQDALGQTMDDLGRGAESFGRTSFGQGLNAPYCAVRVTGALFHTQGGLLVEPHTARVRAKSGSVFDNLYAVGGAACGVSGAADDGYLSGNGLLSAVTLGQIAGRHCKSEGAQ